MISNKKSYAMKMLQLALALSLLHYNPDYLLHRWDSQLELGTHGDGWELEMLRSVHRLDMDQNPYGNRKGLSPRIEDLLNFDDPSLGEMGNGVKEYKLPTSFNGSTFVMNLHNTTGNSSVQTAALQDVQSNSAGATASSVAVANGGAPTSGGPASGSALSEIHIDTASLATGNANHSLLHPAPELDIFLSPHVLQDQRSIWEQNLADLHDYNDLNLQASPYANLPLKDGQQQPPNSSHLDLSLAALIHGFTSGSATPLSNAALNDSTPHPRNLGSSTNNSAGRNDDGEESLYLGRLFGQDEDDEYEGEMAGGVANACEVEGLTTDEPFGSATFANEVEIGVDEEESEIAEVLYKQDVDLGFSLDQEAIINASYASGNSGATNAKSKLEEEAKSSDPSMADTSASKDTDVSAGNEAGKASADDIEKLKALEELNQDKEKDIENPLEDITNEWNGIPFTIDNETGEYIRLPLDELLNDVLQLSEFPLEDELSDDPVPSTSQAAAALNENQALRIVSETGEDFLSGEGVPNKQRRIGAENKENDREKGDENSFSVSDFEDLQNSVGSPLFDLDEDAKKELDEMLQSTAPPYHHPHPHHGHPHAHPHSHHHATMHHAHAHHAAAAAAAHQRAVQQANYGGGVGVGVGVGSGTGSAFQRQPAAGGFHHGHHQGRMSRLNRSVSMERLQDFATYFSPIPSMVGGVSDMSPYPHHYPSYSYQASPSNGAPAPGQHGQYGSGATAPLQPPPPPPPHHATMLHHPNAALGDICPTGQPHYGHNLGSAVTSSMHLTNSSHEADSAAAAAAAYKVEHDLMYYGNTSSDINQTDGFINSIFADEDLHLMDMNESFCRMVDNSTSNNSSVLGLPSSGHVSNGSGSSAQLGAGNPHGNQVNGASGGVGPMSGSTVGTGAAGMTADLLASGGAGAQGGTDRLDASSDSAVSSMGSERVPSLSDGEWGEGSDSAQDYHQGKYGGPYDFSYNNNSRLSSATRQPPVAQKKHQLYGKRDPHKQTPSALPPTVPPAAATAVQSQSIKYEYDAGYASSGMASGGLPSEPGAMGPALTKDYHHQAYGMGASGSTFSGDYTVRPSPRTSQDLVQLNHTYSLPQGSGSLPRPQVRDKKPVVATKNVSKGTSAGSSSSAGGSSSSIEDEHLTRDEKRARSLNIPISVQDIINLPMDEFNERLSKYDLSENQLSLIRDIRRRGKNKVAAQNCRKRKLDQILTLEDEVIAVVKRKTELNQNRDHLESERKRISNKFAMLHRHVFQYLRDPEGNPCSPADYSLQQAADGSVYLLPREKSEGNTTATAASNAVSSAGAGSLNGHVTAQAPMHGHHSQHGMQAQHVGSGLSQQQQQQSRLPPHLQQQQQLHLQSQQQQPGGQQQQQHRKE